MRRSRSRAEQAQQSICYFVYPYTLQNDGDWRENVVVPNFAGLLVPLRTRSVSQYLTNQIHAHARVLSIFQGHAPERESERLAGACAPASE